MDLILSEMSELSLLECSPLEQHLNLSLSLRHLVESGYKPVSRDAFKNIGGG